LILPYWSSFGGGAAQVGNVDQPPIGLVAARDKPVAVVRVHDHGKPHLLEVVAATGLLRLRFGSAQRGQKHSREDGDDRDDNQQLNQRESYVPVVI